MSSTDNDATKTKESAHLCAHCNKSASKSCSACREAPDGRGGLVETRWYCSSVCQVADRKIHVKDCKAAEARKVLYRAGNIAQQLFYNWRKLLFDKLIVKVERSAGGIPAEMIIHEGHYGDEIFIPFPSHLVPDKDEKKALLAYLSCGDALAYLVGMLKVMLKGITSNVVEIRMRVIQAPLAIRLMHVIGTEDKSNYAHEALKFTLRNGESYIMDLTGAQYGYFGSPVIPAKAYFEERSMSIIEVRPWGCSHQDMTKHIGQPSLEGAIRSFLEEFHKILNCTVEWYGVKFMTLGAILRLENGAYQKTQAFFVIHTNIVLRNSKKEGDDKGVWKVVKKAKGSPSADTSRIQEVTNAAGSEDGTSAHSDLDEWLRTMSVQQKGRIYWY